MILNKELAKVIAEHRIDEDDDVSQLQSQLHEAKSNGNFLSLWVSEFYTKRSDKLYLSLTGDTTVNALEMKATNSAYFFELFKNELLRSLLKLPLNDFLTYSMKMFLSSSESISHALTTNLIPDYYMENFGIRSPKYSKLYMKLFGEHSSVIKMFNDRPSDIDDVSTWVDENKSVVVSLLASNVMKMTTGNSFSSCQDYEETSYDGQHLSALPSSVNDNMLAIAYVKEKEGSFIEPYMCSRVLLSLHLHVTPDDKEETFIIAHNLYGSREDKEILATTLGLLYGDRIMFAENNYDEDTEESAYYYNRDIRVNVESGSRMVECYMCEGDGRVEAEVVGHGFTFTTECPSCEGTGEHENNDCDEYEEFPYSNDKEAVGYHESHVPNTNQYVTCKTTNYPIALIQKALQSDKQLVKN